LKKLFSFLPLLLFIFLFSKFSFAQINYEFDFNKNWEWFNLYSSEPAISNQLIKNIQDLSKEWSLEEARNLFRCLTKLDSLNRILDLPKIIDTDSNANKNNWKIIASSELKYFSEPETFRGLISTATTITKIKKRFFPDRKLFDNRKFYIKVTDKIDTSSHITYNFSGAADIYNLCVVNELGEKELKILNESPGINSMFKKQNQYFNKELFVQFLKLSNNKNPLVEIYKLINPYSFGGVGYLSAHRNEFRNVITSLNAKQENLKFYSINLLSQFFPKDAWLEANVLFAFGNFDKVHKYYLSASEEYQEKMLVNLDVIGDDYEYLARYITRRLFTYEKYNTQIDVLPYFFTKEDTLMLQLMTEVYDGGISNYMAPILDENRPLALLEIDFFHFKATTNAILFKRKKSIVDSLLKAGFGERFLFYTMGTQMAYTIDRTLGRTALNEALIYGPLEFFKIYIDAYEADKKQINEKFRFNSDLERKILDMRKKIPKEMYKEMYDINVKYKDPAPIPGVLEKNKKKYIEDKSEAFYFYLIGAQLLFDNLFYEKSLVYFSKIISELPDKNNVSRRLGLAYFDREAYTEAVEMFNYYLKYSPLSEDPYMQRGKAYFMLKQFAQAKTDFEKVIQINSDNEEAKQFLEQVKENGF
jgi:tetratricopeptide (TPR) repeat protein